MPKFDLRSLLIVVGIVAVICSVAVIPGAYAVHLPIAIIFCLAVFCVSEVYRHYKRPSPLNFATHWRLCIYATALMSVSLIYFSVVDYAVSHYLAQREFHDLRSQLLDIKSPSAVREELLAVRNNVMPANSMAQTRLPIPVDSLPDSIRQLMPEKAVVSQGGLGVYFFANQQHQAKAFMLFAAVRKTEPPEQYVEVAPGLWLFQDP